MPPPPASARRATARGGRRSCAKPEAIFAEHGDIPFVHWASYEKTKIDLYLSRYGDRDGIAARVKENLLDLLPITYESVALPSSSYSLKLVEQIAGYERQLTDAGGDWSMARYIEATETDDEGLRSSIMDEILDYNREDLEATWAVLRWLEELDAKSVTATPPIRPINQPFATFRRLRTLISSQKRG